MLGGIICKSFDFGCNWLEILILGGIGSGSFFLGGMGWKY